MIDFNYKILSGIVNFFLFNSMGIFFYLYSVYFIDLFLRVYIMFTVNLLTTGNWLKYCVSKHNPGRRQ